MGVGQCMSHLIWLRKYLVSRLYSCWQIESTQRKVLILFCSRLSTSLPIDSEGLKFQTIHSFSDSLSMLQGSVLGPSSFPLIISNLIDHLLIIWNLFMVPIFRGCIKNVNKTHPTLSWENGGCGPTLTAANCTQVSHRSSLLSSSNSHAPSTRLKFQAKISISLKQTCCQQGS